MTARNETSIDRRMMISIGATVLTRRILVISAAETIVPGVLLAGENEITTASDRAEGVEQAVAILPDYIVLPSSEESLAIAKEIMARLPEDCCPAFLIAGSSRIEGGTARTPVSYSEANGDPFHPADRIRCHGLYLDRAKLSAAIEDRELSLTLMEFSILWTLAVKPGHVRTRDDLVACCRRERTVVGRRTIDQHIRALRKKLDTHGDLIETIRGLGYRFRDCEGVSVVDGCVVC